MEFKNSYAYTVEKLEYAYNIIYFPRFFYFCSALLKCEIENLE